MHILEGWEGIKVPFRLTFSDGTQIGGQMIVTHVKQPASLPDVPFDVTHNGFDGFLDSLKGNEGGVMEGTWEYEELSCQMAKVEARMTRLKGKIAVLGEKAEGKRSV